MIQISVAVPDRPGELARTIKLLSRRGVDIKAIYLSRTNGEVPEGLVRMIVTQPAAAVAALKEGGFAPVEEKVIVIALDDHPGGMAPALDALAAESINLEYAYGFVSHDVRRALSILGVADREGARGVLVKAGITVVDEQAPPDSPNHITAYLGGEWYW